MSDPVVFISYAHEDKPIACILADALKSAGCRVWIDEGELRVGDSLVWTVSEALRGAGFVVALVSEHSLASRWCQKELGMAVNNQLRDGFVRVLAVRVGAVPIPPPLDDIIYQQLDPDSPTDAIPPILRAVLDHDHDVTGVPSRLGADQPLVFAPAARIAPIEPPLEAPYPNYPVPTHELLVAVMNGGTGPALEVEADVHFQWPGGSWMNLGRLPAITALPPGASVDRSARAPLGMPWPAYVTADMVRLDGRCRDRRDRVHEINPTTGAA
jgi:TIR domain